MITQTNKEQTIVIKQCRLNAATISVAPWDMSDFYSWTLLFPKQLDQKFWNYSREFNTPANFVPVQFHRDVIQKLVFGLRSRYCMCGQSNGPLTAWYCLRKGNNYPKKENREIWANHLMWSLQKSRA